jgi:hypothetical protein
MFVDQMLDLYRAGVLRRRVYDYLPCSARWPRTARARASSGAARGSARRGAGPGSTTDVAALKAAGVLRSETRSTTAPSSRPTACASMPISRRRARAALARDAWAQLQGGTVMHAGFLLGPRAFYRALVALPESERRLFDMRGVGTSTSSTATIQPARRAAQPRAFREHHDDADDAGRRGLRRPRDGRVVSGVGGQYNFVAMAHALPGARSVLCALDAPQGRRVSSNIVDELRPSTIPRHLRDIAITEYGIADLRGRTDAECVAAMLNIADSRFQDALLRREARQQDRRGLPIPEQFRRNTPSGSRSVRRAAPRGLFSEYPFGTDLTREEIELARALRWLKENTAERARAATSRAPCCTAARAAKRPISRV